MNLKIVKYFSFLAIILLFGFCLPTDVKDKSKQTVIQKTMVGGLKQGHYLNQTVDDKFSKKVFDLYMKSLDFNKKFLIQSDIKKLKDYEEKLDNSINEGDFEFLDESVKIIEKRLDEAEKYYEEILSKPFDYTKEEEIEIDAEKMAYAKDKDELKNNWRLAMKYQTMLDLASKLERQKDEDADSTLKAKSFETLEKEAREKVLKSNDDWFRRLKRLEATDRFNTYMKCITLAYDPHSTFYPPKEKEDFDISISGKLEGIGATLQEKDGYVKVIRIVPGSASWRQGELKAGDIIMKVAQGEEDPVDIVGMRLDNAVKLIRGKKGTEVRLTVKKVDGTITVIPIIRDVVILAETYAKSAVIEHDKVGKKMGYINLPKFYADFRNPNGRMCSDDVQAELVKLKGENVDGIILDLRDNGGGSLNDVVKMAGYFFPQGPVVQVKSRYGSARVLSDPDGGVTYDGPLVIMVNSLSASASEILAACIQDYGRGIIVGSPTYGKGTVQRILDLDRAINSDEAQFKPLGALKLTTQKFYRINGGATQLKGVTPDVMLPDDYTYIEFGEKEMDYALEWDEIKKADYLEYTDVSKKLKKIKSNSKTRVDESETFALIDEQARNLKKQRDKTHISLNLKQYQAEQHARKVENKKYKAINKEIPDIKVSAPALDLITYKADSSKMASFTDMSDNLKKDAHLEEAVKVLSDLISKN